MSDLSGSGIELRERPSPASEAGWPMEIRMLHNEVMEDYFMFLKGFVSGAEDGSQVIDLAKERHFLEWEGGLTVVDGAERGPSVPNGTSLADLRPVEVLQPGEGFPSLTGDRLIWENDRLRDAAAANNAPWGRSLLWRMLVEGVPEHLDQWRHEYLFVGDRDLRNKAGEEVVLGLCWQYYKRSCNRCWYIFARPFGGYLSETMQLLTI